MIHSANSSHAANIEPPPACGSTELPDSMAPDSGSPVRAMVTLPARPEQLAEARRFVADFVGRSTLAADAALCLSEVATNAVIHSNSRRAGGWFIVTAELHGDGCLHIEVEDQGGRWLERAKPEGQRHLGLTIVRELASAWGIESHGSERRGVWFELRPVSVVSAA
jgi:serine/threonine-protein kinase RsbW